MNILRHVNKSVLAMVHTQAHIHTHTHTHTHIYIYIYTFLFIYYTCHVYYIIYSEIIRFVSVKLKTISGYYKEELKGLILDSI